MTEDRFRLPHLWRRMVLIGLVLVAGPAMAWSAIWITRAYVVPSRVAVHRPAIATPAQTPAPLERTAPPAFASAAGDPLYKLAMAGNEPLQASASAAQAETTASIAPPENVPLPRPKPRITVAAIAGPVPLPRARPQRPE